MWNVSSDGALGVENAALEVFASPTSIGNGILSSVIVYDDV